MSIPITDKFKPKGAGGFALVDAVDVEMPDGTRLSDFKAGSMNVVTYDIASMGLPNLMLNGDPLEIKMDTAEFARIHATSIIVLNLNVEYKGMVVENTKATFLPNGNVATNDILLTRFFVSLYYTEGKVVLRAVLDESSWNDLLDKPFYEESSSETLLEESAYDGFYEDPSLGVLVCDLYPSPFTLTVGEIYRVHWNDEEFICKAQDVSAYVDGAVGLGDLSLPVFGGSGNGEPFIIGYAGEYGSMFISLDNKSSNTVAIYHEISEVKTLDAKFLPSPASIDLSAFESDGNIVETFADGSSKTTTVEFDENGNPVKITNGDGHITTLTW